MDDERTAKYFKVSMFVVAIVVIAHLIVNVFIPAHEADIICRSRFDKAMGGLAAPFDDTQICIVYNTCSIGDSEVYKKCE